MAKRIPWPLVVGALLIGWFVQEDDKVATDQAPVAQRFSREPTPSTKSVVRIITPPKQTTSIARGPRPNVSIAPRTKPPASIGADPQKTMYVDASRLNVRAGPGTNHKRLWTLKRDETVTVIGQSGEWRQVRSTRYQGWVHGGYLTPKKTPSATVSARPPKPQKPVLSDAKIRQILIRRSIALYSGACPCPYNRMRNGRKCGGNSAWSRPGGASPLCYSKDITKAMIAAYRARH